MHESVLDFVKRSTRKRKVQRVLDVGSADINGSARELFDLEAVEYVGVDLDPGPGVDVVGDAHNLVELLGATAGPGFDLVLCLEMLEHDDAPWLTVPQLARMVTPSGIVLVSARGNGFPEHNRPDRWRFMRDGMASLLEGGGLHVVRIAGDPQVSGWLAACRRAADGE